MMSFTSIPSNREMLLRLPTSPPFSQNLMGISNQTPIFLSLLFFILALDGFQAYSTVALQDPLADIVCNLVDCGHGKCKPISNLTFPPFECECDPGWKGFKSGLINWPPCIFPNCTIDFGCESASQSPPPPPFQLFPPTINISDPCSYTHCGDGSCVKDGSGYRCDCNEGSSNLLNMTALPCFKPCSLSANCNSGQPAPVPGPPSSSPPKNGERWLYHILVLLILLRCSLAF